jgi:tetratricopeptide (TPR) repeat protein
MGLRQVVAGSVVASVLVTGAVAQMLNARERAQPSYDAGLAHMQNEAFDAAVASFRGAIIIDPSFEMAHYMLGRVQLMLRQYAAATNSLVKARDLFAAQANEHFDSKADLQRHRRERINDMTNEISRLQQQARQTPQVQEQIRQYTERRRQLQDADRESGLTPQQAVPAFVWLSLGSAYFRSGKLGDAEQAYLSAITADSKMGEAHNNLAVVYMETGRLDQAEKSVKAAEKSGMRVSPALKEEIAKRKSR